MKTARCGRCGYTADVPLILGVQPDLPGAWSTVALKHIGSQMLTMVLCPVCTQRTRYFIAHDDQMSIPAKRLDHLMAIEDAARTMELEAVRSGADS